ncbi:RagB/SusD domain-containing protein [Russula earlei]|uniref:RagB/SusD domain-containing protein n=1 Tax=Russula earlei TaxID=71964 RepID=A0ACC0TYB5_9AGAM|nr:RagB/SusD domain-containing protein [Russula earlei]
MKNKIIVQRYIWVLVVLVLAVSGCTKGLNEYNPSGSATADLLWSTPQGFITNVNGAYSYVPYLYGNDENQLFLSEPGTDLWYNYNKTSYDVDLTQYQNFTSASNPVKGVWTTLYKGINQCNAGIGRIGGAGFTSITDRNQREAELRFLRAFYYWHVVESWGNVILDTLETQSPNLTPKRSPVTDFYKLIISDLQFAATWLPVTYGGTWEYGRATQGAALGLLARAYLSRAYYSTGTEANSYYQLAKNTADQVINNAAAYQVSLYSNYADLWNPASRDNDSVALRNKEALFVATFSTNTAIDINGNGNRTNLWFLTNYSGYSGNAIPGLTISIKYGNDQKNRRFMPTWALLNFYNDTMDARYAASFQEVWLCNKAYTWTAADATTFGKNAGIVGTQLKVGDTAMWITKKRVANKAALKYVVFDRDTTYNISNNAINYGDRYVVLTKHMDPITKTGTTTYPGYLNLIVMRLAEMYLIAAEADLQLTNKAEAATYINVLRTRAAKKTPVDYTAAMQVSANDITLDFILDERAREMCGEYQRWFDLKRTGMLGSRIQRYNPDITNFNSNYSIRPVPLAELQAITNAADFGPTPGYN